MNARPEIAAPAATRAGWLQVDLPFIGGLLIAAGLLLDIIALATLSLPFEVIGLIILIVRMRGPLTRVGAARHWALALLFLVVTITLLVYLIGKYFSKNINPPVHILLTLDHSIFVWVMTNSIRPSICCIAHSPHPRCRRTAPSIGSSATCIPPLRR